MFHYRVIIDIGVGDAVIRIPRGHNSTGMGHEEYGWDYRWCLVHEDDGLALKSPSCNQDRGPTVDPMHVPPLMKTRESKRCYHRFG